MVKKVTFNDRVRHGVLAEQNRVKLNDSMQNLAFLQSVNTSCNKGKKK